MLAWPTLNRSRRANSRPFHPRSGRQSVASARIQPETRTAVAPIGLGWPASTKQEGGLAQIYGWRAVILGKRAAATHSELALPIVWAAVRVLSGG